jgi:transcriptional regulator with XRE-family HTH domain
MASSKWRDSRFGKRLKAERERRGWTQPQMANLLSEKGVAPMHATTIAKIEAGSRSVRINEAVGIADLFEVSLDSLLGRKPGTQGSDLTYRLSVLAANAHESYLLVTTIMRTVHEPLEELPDEFDGSDNLREMGYHALSRLEPARKALAELSSASEEFLLREDARLNETQS